MRPGQPVRDLRGIIARQEYGISSYGPATIRSCRNEITNLRRVLLISIADIRTIGDFISIKMVSSTPKYPVFGGRDAFAYKGTLGGSIMGV